MNVHAGLRPTMPVELAHQIELLRPYVDKYFEMVPGISMTARDKKNTYDTEEIDVALWNEQHAKGFKTLNFLIRVECKNWSSPVGSMREDSPASCFHSASGPARA